MLCLQCKLIEHNNHICSDLGPEAANHRIKLTNDQKTLTDSIKQVEELIRQCAKVSAPYHIEYMIKFASSAHKGWQSLSTITILFRWKTTDAPQHSQVRPAGCNHALQKNSTMSNHNI